MRTALLGRGLRSLCGSHIPVGFRPIPVSTAVLRAALCGGRAPKPGGAQLAQGDITTRQGGACVPRGGWGGRAGTHLALPRPRAAHWVSLSSQMSSSSSSSKGWMWSPQQASNRAALGCGSHVFTQPEAGRSHTRWAPGEQPLAPLPTTAMSAHRPQTEETHTVLVGVDVEVDLCDPVEGSAGRTKTKPLSAWHLGDPLQAAARWARRAGRRPRESVAQSSGAESTRPTPRPVQGCGHPVGPMPRARLLSPRL